MKVEQITNFEQLRQVALILQKENDYLHRRLAELTAKLQDALGADKASLQLEIALLKEQLDARERELFGASSEKRSRPKGEEKTPEEKTPRQGHGPNEQTRLPLVEKVHELDEPDKTCPTCGGMLEEMVGQYEESEEVDVIERSFVLIKHRRKKYRCNCAACVETAPGPVKLIPGGRYSIDFAVAVAIDKYCDHMPLARQERRMERRGLAVNAQTLYDQIAALRNHLLPTYEAIYRYVLSRPVIGADETTWRLMDKPGSTKYWAWAVSCPNAVAYRILKSRSAEAAAEVLGDYRGVVVADGYGAYGALAQVNGAHQKKLPLVRGDDDAPTRAGPRFRLAHCWAHARRKWVEAEPHYPEASEVIDLIGHLYAVEERGRTADVEDRLAYLAELRRSESRKILDEIRRWMDGRGVLPRSALAKAIGYTQELWKGLEMFIDDPAIPIDNNQTERGMRGVAVGRKNHYGSKSIDGTRVAALFYTFIETAKLSGVEPARYLGLAARRAIENPGTVTLPWGLDAE